MTIRNGKYGYTDSVSGKWIEFDPQPEFDTIESLKAENAKLKDQIEEVKKWRLLAHEVFGVPLRGTVTSNHLADILEIPAEVHSPERIAYAEKMRALFDARDY